MIKPEVRKAPLLKKVASPSACLPPEYMKADAYAIQQLHKGEANADQQRRALRWIVEVASSVYDMSYRPESERDTCFSEGRRFVGNQIIKLSKMNLDKIKD